MRVREANTSAVMAVQVTHGSASALGLPHSPSLAWWMQVSVAAMVRVPPKEWKHWGGQVAPMRFDFVLVERGSSYAAAAIELDDKTHLLPERVRRDKFLNETCRRARLPLIRFKTARRYDVCEIRETVKAALSNGAGTARPGEPSSRPHKGRPLAWIWKRGAA